MRGIISLALLLVLSGCTTVTIPNYIQDKNPYKQTFYAQFDQTREATLRTFKELGWMIEKEAKPSLFERGRGSVMGDKQTLIFTEIRQTSLFVGSRYARLNAYLRATADNETEIEIRYLTVTSVPLKNFNQYKNDSAVDRIFRHIEEVLNL